MNDGRTAAAPAPGGDELARHAKPEGHSLTPPISRQSLHDIVASRLRDMIIEGVLAPGERFNESRLVEDLGISRTPLREAIKTLAGEGLIEVRPSRGTFVRSFSAEEFKGMLEVLGELEAFAGVLACERASDAQIEEIKALHARMMQLYEDRERLAYYKENQRIHSLIAAASGNATLTELQAMLQSRMKRLRFTGNSEPGKWRAAVAEHQEMVDALSRRDGPALAEVMRRHLVKTWDRVRDQLE